RPLRITAFANVKTVVLTPIPSASASAATTVNHLSLERRRPANRTSCQKFMTFPDRSLVVNRDMVEQAQSRRRQGRSTVEIDPQSLISPRSIDCSDQKRNPGERCAERYGAYARLQRP